MVNEKEKVKEEEPTPDNSGEGDKSELAKETDAANAAAERMEKATEELKAAEAKQKLSGVIPAGQATKKEEEETPAEYTQRTMKNE